MAELTQTHRPTVTEAVADLFAQYPFPGRNAVWLVDEFVRIAQHHGDLDLRCDVRPDGRRLTDHTSDPPTEYPAFRVGNFRTALARVARMGNDETWTDVSPYGGQYSVTRSSESGRVRLDVTFCNTPAEQSLRIVRVPVPRPTASTAPAATAVS